MRWPGGGAPAGVATVAAAASETTGMLVPHRGEKYAPGPTLVPQRVQNERPATVIERSRLVTGDYACGCSNIASVDGEATVSSPGGGSPDSAEHRGQRRGAPGRRPPVRPRDGGHLPPGPERGAAQGRQQHRGGRRGEARGGARPLEG